jgi:hypothetical protein
VVRKRPKPWHKAPDHDHRQDRARRGRERSASLMMGVIGLKGLPPEVLERRLAVLKPADRQMVRQLLGP